MSPQLTNRSDRRSIHEHDSVGGRGDFSGGNVHLVGHSPSVKSSKTSVHDEKHIGRSTFSESKLKYNRLSVLTVIVSVLRPMQIMISLPSVQQSDHLPTLSMINVIAQLERWISPLQKINWLRVRYSR